MSPTTDFRRAQPSVYLGLFNDSTSSLKSNHTINKANHIFAIELDAVKNVEVEDIDNNHVGIDVNSLISYDSASAKYYSDVEKQNKTMLLTSGKAMQVWIEYEHSEMLVNVTLAPFNHPKPSKCLLSKYYNLSDVLLDSMFVGFSSSTGICPNSHYILGWSWNQSGKAHDLEPSKLPHLPRFKHRKLTLNQKIFIVLLGVVLLLLLMISSSFLIFWRKRYEELVESWEKEYASYRFSYKDLYVATKGFRESEFLGVGGFGKVYKGVVPSTNTQIAVKRILHDSQQGMKEFVAEISSMSRLRHRNLVQLLGYCRRKGELILVYDYMPNGSLDKFLFNKEETSNLNWFSRFKIIKGVASSLLYLHEEWEQVVLHRDVKASNVLLDADMNARLGDFGLARLYDRNNDPRTTHVVGTIGYIAPEVNITCKPTTSTDVYAFGMFLLEVCCGKRPLSNEDAEDFFLSDWVYDGWKSGDILKTVDPRLEQDYREMEIELMLRLGLMCLHPWAEARPTMRQVIQFLNGSVTLPDLPSEYDIVSCGLMNEGWRGSRSLPLSDFPSSSGTSSMGIMSSTNSVLQYGR